MVDPGEREGENTTAFTGILEELVLSLEGAMGAVFVDDLGESVDYYSKIDPYNLKVMGACGALLCQSVIQSRLDSNCLLGLSARRLSLWIIPVGESYTLIVPLERRTWVPELEEALVRAAQLLREEAGMEMTDTEGT